MVYAGIDIGSITAKAALIRDNQILETHIMPTGYNPSASGTRVFEVLLEKSGLLRTQIRAIVSTGYGRNSLDFSDKTLTEIICHGAGAHFIHPEIRGIIDVGGQDSKAILIDENGQVQDFAMNDKCAAGTGRFLDVMAHALEVELDQLGQFSQNADAPVKISSVCTVFAESEVISMIAHQQTRENIIAGIHESAAARVAVLARQIQIKEPVMMTGGVAKNKGMVLALETLLGFKLAVGDMAQETGAVGAAVMASRL